MEIKKLIEGLNEINLYLYELTKVSDEDEITDENKHIKYFYEILDEVTQKLRKENEK